MSDLRRKLQAVALAIVVLAIIALFWMWYLSPDRWKEPPPRLSPELPK